MARGVALSTLLSDLRVEIGDATDPALGANKRAALVRRLQRVQEFLYDDHDWPFLKIQETQALNAGQRFYDFPANIPLEQMGHIDVQWGGDHQPLIQGIDGEQYSALESAQTGATGSFKITAGAAAAATGGFTINAGTLGGSNVLSQITVNGSTTLLASSVAWGTSHTATAAAVVAAVNARTATTGYSATNIGAAITLYAPPNLGTTANGYTVSVGVGGDVTVTSISNFASGAANFITAVTVDGVNIISGTNLGWRTSNAATATALAALINATVTSPQYTAAAAGNRVDITASSEGEDVGNDLALLVTVSGSVTCSTPVDLTGGIISERADPVQRYDIRNNDNTVQIEYWPVPATSGTQVARIYGKRPLLALVADDDVCTLDSTLLVLTAAAEEKGGSKSKDGQRLAQMAASRYAKLKGRTTGKRSSFSFAPGVRSSGSRRPGIRVAYVRTP